MKFFDRVFRSRDITPLLPQEFHKTVRFAKHERMRKGISLFYHNTNRGGA